MAVVIMLAVAFSPTVSAESESNAAWTDGADTWRVELSSSKVSNKDVLSVVMYKNGEKIEPVSIASDTGKAQDPYSSTDGTNVGSWGFDDEGYGPFNSFYAAFDPNDGNKMICHLDPDNLKLSVDHSLNVTNSGYNIMWCLPTVYWGTKSGGTLVLSNEENIEGVSDMQAYAHTVYVGNEKVVYPFLAIGVYEGNTVNKSGDQENPDYDLRSTSGVWSDSYKTKNLLETIEVNPMDATGTGNFDSYSMPWNFYQWELYKYCALSVMGSWDSKSAAGYGVSRAGASYCINGTRDDSGPYSGDRTEYEERTKYTSVKVFIENAWGNRNDYVYGFAMDAKSTSSGEQYFYASQALEPGSKISGSDWTKVGTNPFMGRQSRLATPSNSAQAWGLPTAYIDDSNKAMGFSFHMGGNDAVIGLVVGGGGGSETYTVSISSMSDVTGWTSGLAARLSMLFTTDPLATVTYDHSMLTDIIGEDAQGVADLPANKSLSAGCTYDRLPNVLGYKHVGWIIGDEVVGPDSEAVHLYSHEAKSVWEKQTVTYDHGRLRSLLQEFGLPDSLMEGLPDGVDIGTGTGYAQLPDVGEFRHTGWIVDGVEYPAEHGFVSQDSHTAVSVWKGLPAVTYDHSQLVSATGDPDSVAGLSTGVEVRGHTGYEQLPDRDGYSHVGWLVEGRTVGPTASFVVKTSHTATSLWSKIPTVAFDHSNLTDIVGTDAEGVSGLIGSMEIAGNSGYPKLPDTAGYRHTGWMVDGRLVEPTAGFVSQTTHEAKSVWVKISGFVPIIVDDGDEAIEVVVEEGSEPWLGRHGMSVLLIALVAVIVGELAVLNISRRRRCAGCKSPFEQESE